MEISLAIGSKDTQFKAWLWVGPAGQPVGEQVKFHHSTLMEADKNASKKKKRENYLYIYIIIYKYIIIYIY